ncbi:MAG: tetratricopeptide repeat protein [Deltaproteobacteria bacterium]|nr:tetratricopeptide repeat protein [Deltaproteobacteria bacterium]
MFEQVWQYIADPDYQRFGLSLVLALAAGFLIGRYFKARYSNKRNPVIDKGDGAFFKGIQYLLSDDTDHAIEEFTKSVQINSDTIETYVTLGNLYRSKGDIDRAVHIRKTIILRQNIDEETKLSALYDLGLDYKKGGFIDRALESFLKVLQKQPSNLSALQELEKIYEELKDWENAFSTRQRIAKLSKGDHSNILAHHKAEEGKTLFEKNEPAKARSAFKKAISINKHCIDAYLHLGDLYLSNGDFKKAMSTWRRIVDISPQLTFLAYRRLENAYDKFKDVKQIENFLKECAQSNSDAFTRLALARYMYNEKKYDEALDELKRALEIDASFWEARRFMGEILLETGRKDEALFAYRDLLTRLNIPYPEFQCVNCGFQPNDLKWQCPQCKKWDTISIIDKRVKDIKAVSQPEMLPDESRDQSDEELQ